MGSGVEGVSGPLHLTHVRPHLDAVFYLGPTVQDSLQQTGVSPVETTKMVQGPWGDHGWEEAEGPAHPGKEKT